MRPRRILFATLLLASAVALAGCKTDKERAAEHLSSAVKLAQSGDTARAGIEFRNALKLDPGNRAARIDFAKMFEAQGNKAAAYGQYAALVEHRPDDLEALKAAARLAADLNDWKAAGAQAAAGLKLAPEDPDLLAVRAAVDYATAFSAGDDAAREAAANRARALIDTLPDTLLLRRLVIDDDIRAQRLDQAMAEIDAALKVAPKARGFYAQRLAVLAARKDKGGIEAQLKQLIALFPGDPAMEATLLRWYVSQGDLDKAEAYLRIDAGKDGPDRARARLSLVTFLARFRSSDAALAELDRILAAPADETGGGTQGETDAPRITLNTFRALRASILFDHGKRDTGIAAMKAIVAGAAPSDEIRGIKVELARMEFATGDAVDARALVEQVLGEDKGQVEALKLKAGWLIDGDDTDGAIALLRDVLDARPRDVQAMTMMARAYERAGRRDLMGDMLSRAVDASNKAPAESLRYADYLAKTGKDLAAESVLVDALRLDPKNVSLLEPLGRLYVKLKDWPRAGGVADRLDEIGTPQAKAATQSLRPEILAGQQNLTAAVEYLQGLADEGQGGIDAQIAVIRSLLAQGKADAAKAAADKLLAGKPDDPVRRFLAASVAAATGDVPGAEAAYRTLLKEDPGRDRVWSALARLLTTTGHPDQAAAAVEEGLKTLPASAPLLLLKAGFLEQGGKIDEAIAIYDGLYRRNSGDAIVANNLATLLASYHGDDPKALDRAWLVARRLVDTKEPAFADTYGWIAYLRGDPQTALAYLETAADGLPRDPMVQFHLAEAYRTLKRNADARGQYNRVVALVGKDDTRAFVEAARKYAGAAAAEN